jgi:hypothetical protein
MSILLLTSFFVSTRWTVAWSFGDYYGAVLYRGCFEVTRWPDDWRDRYSPSFRTSGIQLWRTPTEENANRLIWWPETNQHMWGVRYARLPIWIPLVVVGGLTAFLWRHRTRADLSGKYHTCGYDLTGNVTGRCPECGKVYRAEPFG